MVRTTADVDVMVNRGDLDAAKAALTNAAFIYAEVAAMPTFLDGPSAGPRDAVHILFAGEKVRPDDILPNPDLTESEPGDQFRVLSLEPLVRMKLASNRDKDRTHLRDFLEVGLIDASWINRFPPELAALQHILDTPGG